MYATQTYLGFTAGEARLYAYAITEAYRDERSRLLEKEFKKRVSEFGLSTGSNIAVLMPHEGFEEATSRQIQSKTEKEMQEFYRDNIFGKTPGLLLTKTPVDTRKAWQGAFYIPFNGVEHPFRESKRLIETIKSIANNKEAEGRFASSLRSLNDFVVLKPTVFGVGLDINQILTALLDRSQSERAVSN